MVADNAGFLIRLPATVAGNAGFLIRLPAMEAGNAGAWAGGW